MPGISSPFIIDGVAVVSVSTEVNITVAAQLQTVLLEAGRHGHATVVVDMTRTRQCDLSGAHVLAEAHRRAAVEGSELRLVIPAGSPVARILKLSGMNRALHTFGSLDEALVPWPAAESLPLHPPPSPGRPGPA